MIAKTITEVIKQKFRRFVVLVLISIPLMTYYPIALHLTRSVEFATLSTALLSVVAYVLSALKQPSLWQKVSESIPIRDIPEKGKPLNGTAQGVKTKKGANTSHTGEGGVPTEP